MLGSRRPVGRVTASSAPQRAFISRGGGQAFMNVTLGIESFIYYKTPFDTGLPVKGHPGAEFGLANGINNFLEKDIQTLFSDKANQ